MKKLIDSNQEELLRCTLEAYRAALEAIGNSGVQACPPAGSQLQVGLRNLQRRLADETTPRLVQETNQRVEAELQQWGDRSAEYYKGKTEEFKEIMMIMARTAEAVGDRDQRYSKRFTEFTTRLHALASMDDLTKIRDSLVSSAHELQAGVNQMAQDGEEAVARMRGELRQYQAKLEEAERLASLDCLTGLQNRRRMEAALEVRVSQRTPFSVLVLDLNGFKQVNDTYGHAAGDDVLVQFAKELRAAFRAMDDVGRWGGDEFIVVLDCGMDEAPATGAGSEMGFWRLHRARRRAAGQTPRGCIGGSGDMAGGRNDRRHIGACRCGDVQGKEGGGARAGNGGSGCFR